MDKLKLSLQAWWIVLKNAVVLLAYVPFRSRWAWEKSISYNLQLQDIEEKLNQL